MSNQTQPVTQPPQLPTNAFTTTLPEMFADRFFFAADPVLARLAFGCSRPDGSTGYDAGIRVPTPMMPEMIAVMTRICHQLKIPVPVIPPPEQE